MVCSPALFLYRYTCTRYQYILTGKPYRIDEIMYASDSKTKCHTKAHEITTTFSLDVENGLAGAGRDDRIFCLARPNSRARTGMGKNNYFSSADLESGIGKNYTG